MNDFSAPKSILITGSTGGIGRALALTYAAPGCTLILHARDAAKLEALKLECEQRGAAVIPLLLDLTDCERLISEVDIRCTNTPVDLVIVNAGTTNSIDDAGERWKDIERVLNINLRAAMATISAVLPHMRKRGRGQVALISSLSAYFGIPVTPAYCASKAALKAYGESLRGWLSPQGIAVNVVLPGFVETEMSRRFPAAKPFVLSADSAAERIKAGLGKNQARISFPLPLAIGMWWLAVLPATWSQWLLRRFGFSEIQR